MRVEPHRLGVDRNNRSEVEPLGQITPIKSIGHPRQRPAAPRGGAQEKTRTSTSFRPLEPESSASTNSATWARRPDNGKARPLVKELTAGAAPDYKAAGPALLYKDVASDQRATGNDDQDRDRIRWFGVHRPAFNPAPGQDR